MGSGDGASHSCAVYAFPHIIVCLNLATGDRCPGVDFD